MITIKCAKCQQKIFKYVKIGKGKIWHCWKDRIIDDFSIIDGRVVKCKCGNQIGIDEGKWIKIKNHNVHISGTKTG